MKNKTKIIWSIFLFLTFVFMACDPIDEASDNCHKFITINNNTSLEIYFVEIGKQQQDNELPCNLAPAKIEANSSIEIEEFWDCWEEQIDKTYQGALILKFLEDNSYFLDCELPTTIPNDLFILTKEITTDELRSNDWNIDYP